MPKSLPKLNQLGYINGTKGRADERRGPRSRKGARFDQVIEGARNGLHARRLRGRQRRRDRARCGRVQGHALTAISPTSSTCSLPSCNRNAAQQAEVEFLMDAGDLSVEETLHVICKALDDLHPVRFRARHVPRLRRRGPALSPSLGAPSMTAGRRNGAARSPSISTVPRPAPRWTIEDTALAADQLGAAVPRRPQCSRSLFGIEKDPPRGRDRPDRLRGGQDLPRPLPGR